MNIISSKRLLEQLNSRYATKQFDPNKKLSALDRSALEEALLLTPYSGGLQPRKFIVVTDPAVRAKLLPASHSESDVDVFINHTRGASVESLAPFRGMLVGGTVQSMDEKARDAWARNQTYIALGNLLTSAALRIFRLSWILKSFGFPALK